jgi:hypothetical protein
LRDAIFYPHLRIVRFIASRAAGTLRATDDPFRFLGKKREDGSGISERISKAHRRRTDTGHAHGGAQLKSPLVRSTKKLPERLRIRSTKVQI